MGPKDILSHEAFRHLIGYQISLAKYLLSLQGIVVEYWTNPRGYVSHVSIDLQSRERRQSDALL